MKPSCLMIVEDNPDMRRVISRLVSDIADQIIWCEKAEDALEVFARSNRRPDVVLMDIELGGLDGITATREITKASDATKVIIVTSHNDKTLRQAAYDAGAIAFVLKENLTELPITIGNIR